MKNNSTNDNIDVNDPNPVIGKIIINDIIKDTITLAQFLKL
jgi:hypothetical protein